MKKISIVIPCYKSAASIAKVVREINEVIITRKEFDYEIILINDGSPDNTWDVIKKIAVNDKKIVAINLSRNFGQHNAMMAGYRSVSGDIIVGLDDDGEQNPREMFLLVDKLLEGYDYVCAEYENNRSKFREFGTRINNLMARVLIDKPKNIVFTSYYVMKRFVVDEIIRYEQPYPYIAGLLLRATRKMTTVPLERKKRISGKSGYNFKKMLSLWFNGFTAFSLKPLRIATALGGIIAFCSIIGAIVLLIRRVSGVEYLSGYASLMVCITFCSGVIMILLGVIGEYIGRIYLCISETPQYVVREIYDKREL